MLFRSDLWTEVGGNDMLGRPRSSRIYYRGQFFTYPLKAFEALSKLGLLESALCVLSFMKARIHPTQDPKTFEDWVVNQFGEFGWHGGLPVRSSASLST